MPTIKWESREVLDGFYANAEALLEARGLTSSVHRVAVIKDVLAALSEAHDLDVETPEPGVIAVEREEVVRVLYDSIRAKSGINASAMINVRNGIKAGLDELGI